MPLRSPRSWLLPLAAAVVSVIVLGASLIPRFLDLDTYKAQILAQVKSTLKRELQYQTGEFSLRYGPSFSFSEVVIKEKEGPGDLARAERLTVRIALMPLLRREIVLSRMQLDRPVLRLTRGRDGVFNISDLLSTKSEGPAPGIGGILLKKARIRFTDLALSGRPIVTELSETDLYLSRIVRGKNCDFKLSGNLVSGARTVPVFLAGVAKLPAPGVPMSALEAAGKVRTGALDAAHFWPYYSRYVPFKSLSGTLALDADFRGKVSGFRIKGELEAARVNLDYPQVFHARLTPRSLKASYHLELSGDTLELSSVKLNLDGFKVDGSCRLSDIRSKDLRITAKASSNQFNLRQFRQYIPYGIIVDGPSQFIEQKIKGGIYKLEQGRLDGRVSQILHMERGENYNVLYIDARVEEGVVDYGTDLPVFSGIKGKLELAGKDFHLKGMTGRFGSAPFALEGRITDYPLPAPCQYLFSANVHPRQSEAAWLLGKGRGEKVLLSDGSSARIRGEGTTSVYHMSGEWDLTASSYSYPELISKPATRPNDISFALTFTEEDFRLRSLTYNLAPLTLSASSVSRYDGPVSLELKSNQFPAAEVAPLLPMARKYHPSGRVQAQLRAAGPDTGRLTWGGDISLAGVAFRAGDDIKPISGVNGIIKMSGDSLESSQLSARIGNSPISGHGSLSGFSAPSFTLAFTSPGINLADLGFPQGSVPLRADKVQGNISYSKEILQIGSLSGRLGASTLQMKGSVQRFANPLIDLSVNSPHLELDDILALFGGPAGEGRSITLKANLSAQEGKLLDLPFQRLRTAVSFENRVLDLPSFEFDTLEGEASGKLHAEFATGLPRYQMSCNLQRVAAEKFLKSLGVKKQEMTGKLSLQSELTLRGEGMADFRRTATGTVKLRVEDGSVRKFSTLSKIFSILNVSQLFKLKLPDMVSGGMPFNKITGDFAVKEGIASTQNLFLDSNAINLSAVGKVDLGRNQLDMYLGVQPLQTVDKVVNRIPILGWILTGKDKSFITTYFEAKGPIEDPQVTAVPVKSLAKGVLNVFKRVFQLPEALFTDTGEVMIGK